MDPALWELLKAGDNEDAEEIEAIIRLDDARAKIAGVRIISRFGPIATCRLRRDAILHTREEENVRSLKAPRLLGPEIEPESLSAKLNLRPAVLASDVRRPSGLPLTGAGVVIGIIDWGCDFDHPHFKHPDGTTRLLALWDQRGSPPPQARSFYGYGIVHSKRRINRALASVNPYRSLGYHPADADAGGHGAHGTHVMDIAAGNGLGRGPMGVAPETDLIFVHLADRGTGGLANLGDSVRLLEALDFIARVAGSRPWVVNFSVGRHGGPHDGTTLVEMAFDHALENASNCFLVQSTGNYSGKNIHSSGRLYAGQTRTLSIIVDEADTTPNELEVWYSGQDEFVVRAESPFGVLSPWVRLGEQADIIANNRIVGRIYHRAYDPNNSDNHLDLFLYPNAPPGTWKVILQAERISSNGVFHAWLERDEACPGCQTHFSAPDSDNFYTTGTLANSRIPLVVGAYNAHSPQREVTAFSSVGPTRDHRHKPDLCAPGEGVLAARSSPRGAGKSPGMLVRKSGTSMAAPHVTGAVALCLQGAKRPLRSHEIRELLLNNTAPEPASGRDALRYGQGYLDIARVVEAVLALPSRERTASVYSYAASEEHPFRSKERTMNGKHKEYFDRLEEVIKSATSRTASERDLLAEIMRIASVRSDFDSIDPDTLYHALASNCNGSLPAQIGESFTVFARPGEVPTDSPQVGDVLLRVALGEPGLGHVAVISDPTLWPHKQLANAPFHPESQQPGFYASVVEGGAFPHTHEDRFARRILDSEGRLPFGQLLLRSELAIYNKNSAEDFSSANESERFDESPISQGETVLLSEQQRLVLQNITHAGNYRLAYSGEPVTRHISIIEPLPGRNRRIFQGTAALQTALNNWAPDIQRVLTPAPAYILTGGLFRPDHPNINSLHRTGNAFDLYGFWWSASNIFLAENAPRNWNLYLRIEATLRRVFGTVLNFDYDARHQDHWHCDVGGATNWRAVRSQALFAQRALNVFWGENLSVDGQWGNLGRTAASRHGYDFSVAGGWERFLDNIIIRSSLPNQRIPTNLSSGTGNYANKHAKTKTIQDSRNFGDELDEHPSSSLSAKLEKLEALSLRLAARLRKTQTPFESEHYPQSVNYGVGQAFDYLIPLIQVLEDAATKQGYNLKQCISAFRKIYYNSSGWDIIIPGAKSVSIPSSWQTKYQTEMSDLKQSYQILKIKNNIVDIGHLFTGLDAENHLVSPLLIKWNRIPLLRVSSTNKAQATFTGDLGSVVYEYIKARGNVSFFDAVNKKDAALLSKIYGQFASAADMAGNADAYALNLNNSSSIADNIVAYYTAAKGYGVNMRYSYFYKSIKGNQKTAELISQLVGDIFGGSEAYALGYKNDPGYVTQILLDTPKPFVPTFHKLTHNVTIWTLKIFIDSLEQRIDEELKASTP